MNLFDILCLLFNRFYFLSFLIFIILLEICFKLWLINQLDVNIKGKIEMFEQTSLYLRVYQFDLDNVKLTYTFVMWFYMK